jgi:hypothetical protein
MAVECPKCKVHFVEDSDPATVHGDEYEIEVSAYVCPECGQYVVYAGLPDSTRVYPPDRGWADFSKHVPSPLLKDFEAARKVLDVSPEASAMLGRRCLQHLIEEYFGIKERTLDLEIESVLRKNELPSYLADDLHAVRLVGNFAAHPMKSENTGEMVSVEPGEAAWTIEVLEGLFDFCFVAPQKASQRREALNEKLQDAGRQPMRAAPVIVFPKKAANA